MQREVFHRKDRLCCFGTYDLCIFNDCNINYESWSKLGNDYEFPPQNDVFALAGSYNFKVIEIEVFKLID